MATRASRRNRPEEIGDGGGESPVRVAAASGEGVKKLGRNVGHGSTARCLVCKSRCDVGVGPNAPHLKVLNRQKSVGASRIAGKQKIRARCGRDAVNLLFSLQFTLEQWVAEQEWPIRMWIRPPQALSDRCHR